MRTSRPGRFIGGLLAALLALIAWVGPTQPAWSKKRPPAEEAAEALEIPVTIERVWYRTAKKLGIGGAQMTGDLTITEEGLHFDGRKRDFTIPLDSIHRVSWGRMRGDVDTDWAVLALVDEKGKRIVGFRDGKKLGYGRRSRSIYETILGAARLMSVAQYKVPEGFRTYDGLDFLFTLAVPEGWSAHHRSVIEIDGQPTWGEMLFLPGSERDEGAPGDPWGDHLVEWSVDAVRAGQVGGIFIDRNKAERGMSCIGFTEKARARLLERAERDPLFRGVRGEEESTRTEPWAVDGCHGLRIVRRSRPEEGAEVVLDVRAVCDGETLFLFGLRSRADRFDADVEVFEQAVSHVRFSVAR